MSSGVEAPLPVFRASCLALAPVTAGLNDPMNPKVLVALGACEACKQRAG